MSRSVFVAGCGYTGLAVARLFQRKGWNVAACTHSEESASALADEAFSVVACDISDMADVARLAGFRGVDVLIHCASSGKGGADQYRQVYFTGMQNLVTGLGAGFAIFTSSTSVYAQTDGGWVTEDSPAQPDRETGRVLRETENWVYARGGAVARLAGIYGPGRSVLLRKFFSGEAVIEGDGARWINQIHRDDAASALFKLRSSVAAAFTMLRMTCPSPRRICMPDWRNDSGVRFRLTVPWTPGENVVGRINE
jgi:nucleoside-diphosphate-sugar epimerase